MKLIKNVLCFLLYFGSIGISEVLAAPDLVPVPITQAAYSKPITITKGGTYSGNWESNDPNTPAVTIQTTDPVIIVNSSIRSKGNGISAYVNNAKLTVQQSYGFGLNPNVAGQTKGCFIDTGNFQSVTVENNWIQDYRCGLRALNYGTGFPASGQSVIVRFNRIHNIDGRLSDGKGGYQIVQDTNGQAIGLNSIHQASAEIAWNEIINQPYKSKGEDLISTYESGGTSNAPILIHDNYIQGDYYGDPKADIGATSAMINLGDCPSNNPNCAYVSAYNNRLISFSGSGAGIAGGHHMRLYNNRAVSAQYAPGNILINSQWRIPFGYWNFYKNPQWQENYLYGNYAFVVNRDGQTVPIYVDKSTAAPANLVHDNNIVGKAYTTLASQPAAGSLTTAQEQAEYTAWLATLPTAGKQIGPNGNSLP